MFEKLRNVFFLIRQGKELDSIIRELQIALITSDVSVKVVKELTERIKKRVVEERSRYPGLPLSSIVSRIVYEEMKNIIGERREYPLIPHTLMLIGLYGSGKTTTAGKLALWFKKRGLRPVIVETDDRRPGAREQAKQVAERAGVDFFFVEPSRSEEINALKKRYDVVIVDTAGREENNERLEELERMKITIVPDKTLLVVPADAGQTAARHLEGLARVGIDGVIITRMDGSGKGGAALVVMKEHGVPVYFIGTGEKLEDIEPFDPDRYLQGLVGIKIDVSPKKELKKDIDLYTFHEYIQQARSMGPLDRIAAMMGIKVDIGIAEERLKKYDAIFKSMTEQERRNPDILNESRINRIARGSGTTPADVRAFIKDYKNFVRLVKKLKRGRLPWRGRFIS